jgi:Xaa-Pro dipeptidase
MEKKSMDFLLLFPSANMYYLTGIWPISEERTIFSILSSKGDSTIIAPEMYENQILRQTWIKDIKIWRTKKDFERVFEELLKELKIHKANIAIEDKTCADFIIRLQRRIPRAKISLASSLIKDLRIRKTPEEIEFMKKAGTLAEDIMKKIIENLDTGISELEISGLIEYEARKKGSKRMSFDTIVSFGKNSANPHNMPSEKKLREGNIIMIDLGPRCNGYCSDITRTIFKGKPSKRMEKIVKIVTKAHDKATSAIKPGIKAYELDKLARGVISEYEFEKFFIHGTGHGLGLDIHEEPYIKKDSSIRLDEGMTFTIEPGIYLPNEFGARVENSYLVTDDGYDALTSNPRDLIIV